MNRDNQQATQTKEFQLGYIAAMIDGEGTIGIHKGDQYGNYKPVIKIFNTDLKLIDYVASLMKMNDLPHFVSKSIARYKKIRMRDCYAITISGYKRTNKALEILIPILKAKKRQAELLKEIVESRLDIPMTHKNQMRQYTKYELNLINEIKKENARGKGARALND